MNLQHAARLNALLWPITFCFTLFYMRPGLRIAGVHFPRQGWVVEHPLLWSGGGWLWLVTILAWLWILGGLAWRSLPHWRFATIVQMGLLLIATMLTLSGVIVWMAMLPPAMRQPTAPTLAPLVDALALGLIGVGAGVGGAVAGWIGVELDPQRGLPRGWRWLYIVGGLCALPTPFLLPFPYLLLVAALCWWIGALVLTVWPRQPKALGEQA